jgi:hypothetical protein
MFVSVSSLWLALWYDFLVLHPTWQVSHNNISAVVSGPTPPTSFTTRVITYSLFSNVRCPQMKSCFGIGSFFITRGLKHLGLFHSCVPCFFGWFPHFYIFLPGKSWKKSPMTSKKTSMKLPRGGSYSASGMAIPSPTRSPWRGARAENHQRWPECLGVAPWGATSFNQEWWFHGEIFCFFWDRTSQLDVIWFGIWELFFSEKTWAIVIFERQVIIFFIELNGPWLQ